MKFIKTKKSEATPSKPQEQLIRALAELGVEDGKGMAKPLLVSLLASEDGEEQTSGIKLLATLGAPLREAVLLLRRHTIGRDDESRLLAAHVVAQLHADQRDRGEVGLVFDAVAFLVETAEKMSGGKGRYGVLLRLQRLWQGVYPGQPDLARSLYEEGDAHYQKERYREAEICYSAALLYDAGSSEYHFNRALTRYQLGRWDESISDYEQAAALDPHNPIIFNNRGDAYYRKGDFRAAVRDYDQALRLNPEYVKALYNRGLSNASMEEYDKAVRDFDAVLDLKLDEDLRRSVHHLRGLAHQYAGNLPGAAADYEKSIELGSQEREVETHLQEVRKKITGESGEDADLLARVVERPAIKLADVVGMATVKQELADGFVDLLKRDKLAADYGLTAGGGLLFYGPPGCGKTFIARAIAGETGATFIYLEPSILGMYVGESENNLRKVFAHARSHAPTIICIDELDGLGSKRDDSHAQSWERKTVGQLLIEMTRVEQERLPILVVGITNMPWAVDLALRRAGRIGREMFIPGPDAAAREGLFRHCLDGRPVAQLDYPHLARLTEACSCARIEEICKLAARAACKAARLRGQRIPIEMPGLLAEIERSRPDLREWDQMARSHGLTPDSRPAVGFVRI